MGRFEPLADRESVRSSGRSSASGANSWGWGPTSVNEGSPRALKNDVTASYVLRRFRLPIAARVTVEQGRPVRVVTDARGFSGGKVERCDGPWRSSGDWWAPCAAAAHGTHWWLNKGGQTPFFTQGKRKMGSDPFYSPWNCDEWDVTLSDGASYRISRCITEREPAPRSSAAGAGRTGASRDHQKIEDRGVWFMNGILD
jgi:hypothetical protein